MACYCTEKENVATIVTTTSKIDTNKFAKKKNLQRCELEAFMSDVGNDVPKQCNEMRVRPRIA